MWKFINQYFFIPFEKLSSSLFDSIFFEFLKKIKHTKDSFDLYFNWNLIIFIILCMNFIMYKVNKKKEKKRKLHDLNKICVCVYVWIYWIYLVAVYVTVFFFVKKCVKYDVCTCFTTFKRIKISHKCCVIFKLWC